ncbi:MAG: RnfH family protein [Gammaproteobacteria bacterium]|nr:RnfH family protein [Gammaproteobacteria bacterium]
MHIEVAGSPLPLDGPAGLSLPEGATLADALAALGLDTDAAAGFGIRGRRALPNTLLREGDRIELYRTLEVDPKAARRARAT